MKNLIVFYLKNELKTFRTVIVSSFFVGMTLLMGIYMPDDLFQVLPDGSSQATSIVVSIYVMVGFICSSVLFSGILSHDIESRNLRFITPYFSRKTIFLAKYSVTMIYFVTVFLMSLVILMLFKGHVPVSAQLLVNTLVIYLYTEAIIVFISSISKSEKTSTLLATLISFVFPTVGISAMYFTDKKWLQILQWLTPYPYLDVDVEILYLLALSATFIGLGLYLFEKKEI